MDSGRAGFIIRGAVFEYFNDQTVLYMPLIPMTLMLLALFLFNRMVSKQ